MAVLSLAPVLPVALTTGLASALTGIALLAAPEATAGRVQDVPSRGPAAAVDTRPAAAAPRVLVPSAPAALGRGAAPSPGPGEPRAGPVIPAAPASASTGRGRARWDWPVRAPARVLDRFRVGPQRWSPGHRGIDLGAPVGGPVLAAGPGVVAFAGSVAGRGVVVVAHQGGVRTTYEPVTASVTVGQPVSVGEQVGVLQGAGWHCAPASCLHWGARRGAVYLDPLSLLGRRGPPVLLPLAG